MTEIIAYCGLACHTCPIYLATRLQDKEKQMRRRIEISQLLEGQYGMNFAPEEITDCDGCRTDGNRLFAGCKDCRIRKCASEKGVEFCAFCTEYVCQSLATFFAADAAARTRSDQIRARFVQSGSR